MALSKENIVCGAPIPNHLLESQSNLSQYFIRMLGEHGNATSMIDMHDGSSFTYTDILTASLNIANWLKYELEIKKNDVVGIFSENTIWYPPLLLAIWHVGAVCALFNPMYNTKELTHVLNITKPKLMIPSKACYTIVRNTVENLDFVNYVYPINIIANINILKEISFEPNAIDINDTAVILFSSGTTGLPKGVELSHKSLRLMTSVLNYVNVFVNKSDTMMGLIPMFHGYGLLVICMCMSFSSKLIVLKYFNAELFLKSIQLHKITVLFAVPPLMVFLAKHPIVDQYDLSSLKAIYSGAAPLSYDIQNEVTQRVGKGKLLKVLQGYGMTESCILSTIHNEEEYTVANNSVGQLMYGMLGKVIDLKTGEPLGAYERGELCFKGPLIMKGYYGNPEETSATIDAGGWLHTGDVGYYDKGKYFFIVDRLKELIKYKGYQVAPAELESLLLTHPEIDDAAVTGIPDVEAGELPMAFVVKSFNSTLTEIDVIDFVNKHVSAQKRLRGGVQFVDTIPRNPSGKILRRVIKGLINKSKL